MTPEEFDELNAQVAAVTVQDVHLGRALSAIVAHLPGYSEAEQAQADAAKAKAEAEATAAAQASAEQPAPEAFPAPVESGQSAP